MVTELGQEQGEVNDALHEGTKKKKKNGVIRINISMQYFENENTCPRSMMTKVYF